MRALFLSVIVLAGCAQAPAPADHETDDPAVAQVAVWSYSCDRPGYVVVAAGVCASGFASPTEAITEPFLAVFPGHPDILAIGVNRHETAGVLLDVPTRGRPQLVDTEVWFSTDGGSTWARSRPPDVAGAGSASEVDPTLAFDKGGTLHYSGLLEGGTGEPYVYYTSTSDVGATWTTPIVLAHGNTSGTIDRNWLAIGPDGAIWVTWQAYPHGGGAAWSFDGGATWTRTGEEAIDCIRLSPVAFVEDDALFTCRPTGAVGAPREQYTLAFDRAAGAWTTRSVIPDVDCDGGLFATVRGLLALGCAGSIMTSADAGYTWAEPIDLLGLASVENGWPATTIAWMAGDARGLIHILLKSRDGNELILPARTPIVDERVAHIVLDPYARVITHEQRLTASDPAALRRTPPSLVPAISDDYFGIAPTAEGVYLAWTRDRGIDVAFAGATT
jgi:photosystem II stability/assembly factor-like uncharacterized protein